MHNTVIIPFYKKRSFKHWASKTWKPDIIPLDGTFAFFSLKVRVKLWDLGYDHSSISNVITGAFFKCVLKLVSFTN